MGATSFADPIWTDDTVEDAYREAVDRALFEHGHDPYNGTISSTSGVRVYSGGKPVSMDEAYRIVEDRIEHLSKGEHCEAIRVYEESDEKTERLLDSVTTTVRVSTDIIDKHDEDQRSMLRDAAQKHLNKTAATGTIVGREDMLDGPVDAPAEDSVSVSEQDRKNLRAALWWDFTIQPKIKTATEAPKGRRVTRYFIIDPAQGRMPRWDEGYESQSKARANLPKTLMFDNFRADSPSDWGWEVIAMTRREGGAPLVCHSVSADRAPKTVEVSLTYAVEKVVERPQKTGRTGWVFYGMAAT